MRDVTIKRLRRALHTPALKPVRTAFGWLGSYLDPLVRSADPQFPQERVRSSATYAPWRADPAFRRAYTAIRGHTLVDEYRCYELWSILGETCRRGGDVLEVGVWRGGTGCLLAERCRVLGLDSTVWLCDTFKGVVKASDRDPLYVGGEHDDTTAEVVNDLVARMSLSKVRILTGIFPEDTGWSVADRRFQLCHIDVDVYLAARDVFTWVWPRLVVGGVVVFDDYGFRGCEGVTRCVEEVRAGPDRVTVYNLNGHALVVKIGE